MDKNAIKKYAVWARNELIARVSQRAQRYGITKDQIVDVNADSVNGIILTDTEKKQRQALIQKIRDKGFEQVMEEVAYTWFNRFSALRFMEVNGYLPSHVRVFTDQNNAFRPEIMSEAIHLDLDGLDMEKVYALKEANNDDELFKYLIITQCNDLSNILPGMFQKIADYTELLFPDNLLREGSTIEQMITLIPEDDWKDQVQIIGWLYQYYNTETFNEIYDGDMSRKKIEKNLIPAATQMFTPDWVVRYMVENSLGYIWLQGHPNDELRSTWKYYVNDPEASERNNKYQELTPESIKCIDPCSGSGHILVYLFDVLIQIYQAYGYTVREAASTVIDKNLYGLDIDDRAAQLAYFSVMMKGRQYDRRFFSKKIQPHIFSIYESNNINPDVISYFCNDDQIETDLKSIIKNFHDAKEYGSILQVDKVDFERLFQRLKETDNTASFYRTSILTEIKPLIEEAYVLSQKYEVIATNPPYLNSSRMGKKLNTYVKKIYPEARFDLCMVMYEAIAKNLVSKGGAMALVTTTSWMFISSFEEIRKYVVDNLDFQSLADFGTELFEGKIGHLPITAWVNINDHRHRKFYAIRLVDYCYARRDEKQEQFSNRDNYYITDESWFDIIEGNPLCYWINNAQIDAFKNNPSFVEISPPRTGMMTTNNKLFLKEWFEVDFNKISLNSDSIEASVASGKKWFPYNKGGDFQKWYGNRDLIVNWENAGHDIAAAGMTSFRGKDFYFKEGLTWTIFGYDNFAVRYSPVGSIFDIGGTSTFPPSKILYYVLGYLNSRVASDFITLVNPTVNIQNGDVKRLPLIVNEDAVQYVSELSKENVHLVKEDYDSSEISWDFNRNPLVVMGKESKLESIYEDYNEHLNSSFNRVKQNEIKINEYFAKLYNVEDITNTEVLDKKVSIIKKEKRDLVVELISYAVGCMLGRYSLDVEGLVYAGENWNPEKYKTFAADKDGIIPVCDDEYFEDDITGQFVKFVETVYGSDTLEENLRFIANALSGAGTPREVIRSYFINDFFADHCKTYQKRPIYWLFDSGKKSGFKCLIYMHRYQPDTIARIRTDYVHEQQSRYRTAIADLEQRIEGASTSDRVKLNKKLKHLQEQSVEIHDYEEKIHHLADQYISIDLDDGVKVNYAKFQDVLAKIK